MTVGGCWRRAEIKRQPQRFKNMSENWKPLSSFRSRSLQERCFGGSAATYDDGLVANVIPAHRGFQDTSGILYLLRKGFIQKEEQSTE